MRIKTRFLWPFHQLFPRTRDYLSALQSGFWLYLRLHISRWSSQAHAVTNIKKLALWLLLGYYTVSVVIPIVRLRTVVAYVGLLRNLLEVSVVRRYGSWCFIIVALWVGCLRRRCLPLGVYFGLLWFEVDFHRTLGFLVWVLWVLMDYAGGVPNTFAAMHLGFVPFLWLVLS